MSENKKVSVRAQILDEAKHIVTGERESQYGRPEDNFRTIAELWEVYLQKRCVAGGFYVEILPEDVAIMMALLKVARIATGAGKVDNYVDLAGYAACAGEIRMKNQRQPEEKSAESGEKAEEVSEKPARSGDADDDWWV